jgi:propionyl-CoA carboxylase alpha chain
MAHPRWQAGQLSTGFIAEEFPNGFHRIAPPAETARVVAAVAAAVDHVLGERKRRISGQASGRLVQRERRRVVRLGEAEVTLDIGRAETASPVTPGLVPEAEEVAFAVSFPGNGASHLLASDWKPGDPVWTGTVDGRRVIVQVRPILNGFDLSHQGVEARAFVYTEREANAARLMPAKKAADTGKALRCPMPGLVVSIAVVEGQEVKVGETLAVIEAMKMENVLRAEQDGVVKALKAKPGDSLSVDQVILEFV